MILHCINILYLFQQSCIVEIRLCSMFSYHRWHCNECTSVCWCVYMYTYIYISSCIFLMISFLCLVAQSCLTPWTVACQAPLSMGILQVRILVWVAMPFSRGIFPTLGSNPGFPHCRQILYYLSHQGSPIVKYRVYSSKNSFIPSGTEVISLKWCQFFQPLAYSFGRLLSSGDWLRKPFKLDPLDQAASLRLARKGLEAVYIELLCCTLFELLKVVLYSRGKTFRKWDPSYLGILRALPPSENSVWFYV